MTTTTDSTPTQAVDTAYVLGDAAGREAVYTSGRRVTIVSAAPDTFYLREEPGRPTAAASVVMLPRLGEQVRVDTLSGTVEGLWLGMDDVAPGADSASFHVLVDDHVRTCQAAVTPALEARTTVVRTADPTARNAVTALAAQIVQRQRADQQHEERMRRLVEDAHEYATDNDLCERFDDFMDEHGLPRRSRDYELRIEVRTTVYLTRSGFSLDDAMSRVDSADVFDAINLTSEDYEIEEGV